MKPSIASNVRKAVKLGNCYSAVVVDTSGPRASARLSTNGAIVRNLKVVGGPVLIGQKVNVDYTTYEPTIVATGREGLSVEDLNAALKKLQQKPINKSNEGHIDYIVLYVSGVQAGVFPVDPEGLGAALDVARCGDVVTIPPCQITGNFTITGGVTVQGAGRRATIIDGTFTMDDLSKLSNLRVRNMALEQAGAVSGVIGPAEGTASIFDVSVYASNTGAGTVYALSPQGTGQLVTYFCGLTAEALGGGSAYGGDATTAPILAQFSSVFGTTDAFNGTHATVYCVDYVREPDDCVIIPFTDNLARNFQSYEGQTDDTEDGLYGQGETPGLTCTAEGTSSTPTTIMADYYLWDEFNGRTGGHSLPHGAQSSPNYFYFYETVRTDTTDAVWVNRIDINTLDRDTVTFTPCAGSTFVDQGMVLYTEDIAYIICDTESDGWNDHLYKVDFEANTATVIYNFPDPGGLKYLMLGNSHLFIAHVEALDGWRILYPEWHTSVASHSDGIIWHIFNPEDDSHVALAMQSLPYGEFEDGNVISSPSVQIGDKVITAFGNYSYAVPNAAVIHCLDLSNNTIQTTTIENETGTNDSSIITDVAVPDYTEGVVYIRINGLPSTYSDWNCTIVKYDPSTNTYTTQEITNFWSTAPRLVYDLEHAYLLKAINDGANLQLTLMDNTTLNVIAPWAGTRTEEFPVRIDEDRHTLWRIYGSDLIGYHDDGTTTTKSCPQPTGNPGRGQSIFLHYNRLFVMRYAEQTDIMYTYYYYPPA